MRRTALLWALSIAAGLAFAVTAADAKPAHNSGASFYVVKSAKVKCKPHYTKQTVTVRLRRHHAWVRVHQIRCVYTGSGGGSGGGGGGGGPAFPLNLPTAAITVTAIPTATPDTYSTAANQTLAVSADAGVLSDDTGLGLTAGLISPTAHGTLTLDRNGGFHYTPAAGFSGIDHFTYHATGNGESSGAAQVTIQVLPVAVAPPRYSVASATALSVGAPGLLSGAVGTGLYTQLDSGAANGTVSLGLDGSFTYTPAGGFAGADSFQYEVIDSSGLSSGPLTVTIEVGAAPPVPLSQTFSGAVANTELQIGGVRGSGPEVYQGGGNALAGDSDPNGGSLSTTAATIATTHGGSVALASNGTFTYQPPAGFQGPSDSFTYEVDTSEGTSALATATIDFNGARVWYVDASAPAGGSGTSASPFRSLASVSATGGVGTSGDIVFLFPGSYGGGIALAANEALVGAPAGLSAGSETLLGATGSNPVITNAGGAGITLAGGDTVSAVTVNGTSGAGIAVASANGFTIASNVSVTGAGADGIDVTGGGGNATIAAAISGSAGHSVNVQSRTSGTLTVSGAISDSGGGVLLSGNSGATIAFTGELTASTTGTHPAFQAIGGGTVTSTSPQSTLSAAGAAALDVESTTIGSAGLTFESVSSGSSPSSGPADGIVLSGTGAGALTVSGVGNNAGSGGLIEGTSTAAVSLSGTGPVTLEHMLIEPASGYGVHASVVPSLSVFFSTIRGGDTGVAADGDASTQSSAQTFDIEQNAFSGQNTAAIALTDAGITNGYLQQNQIGSESPVLAGSLTGDGIDVAPSSGGTLTAQFAGNEIDQVHLGNGIDAQAPTGTELDLTLANNTVQMDGTGSQDGVVVGATGTVCLNPTGNAITAAGTGAGANGFEVDQLTSGAVFEIQGYDGVSDTATYLGVHNSLSATGGGSPAVATAAGTGFVTPPGPSLACAAPPPNNGDI